MKKIGILILVSLVLFGCTAPIGISEVSANEFKEIRSSFGMENGLSGDETTLNSYLNKLSGFRGAISGETASVVEAEIASTESFLYLTMALRESNTLNIQSVNCNNISYNNSLAFTSASIGAANKASGLIGGLSKEGQELLRVNQLESVLDYKSNSEELRIVLTDLC